LIGRDRALLLIIILIIVAFAEEFAEEIPRDGAENIGD
jgi:hypothetical protein